MKIEIKKDDLKKVDRKGDLKRLLKHYDGTLNREMTEYLESLIELEFSVVRDYINDKDRTALSELEIYRRVLVYNIYNRALKIFKESERDLLIDDNFDDIEGLKAYAKVGKNNIKLFNFNYDDKYNGDISIYQSLADERVRDAELCRIFKNLEYLYDEDNPYRFQAGPMKFGGPDSRWAVAHQEKIQEYEDKFRQLENRVLTDEDKLEIELTNEFYDLLLDDYDLDGRSFRIKKDLFSNDESLMKKRLVKTLPGVNINKIVNYK